MKTYRIGNDIHFVWRVRGLDDVASNDKIVQLVNMDKNETSPFSYEIHGERIEGTFYGKDQKTVGKYRLLLLVNNGQNEMITLDKVNAFALHGVWSLGIFNGADDSAIETSTVEIESDINAPVPYYKPVDGIPASDLDAAVQAALEKALSALQPDGVKTINGQSIVGHGNIVIQGGAGGDSRPEVIITDERNVTLEEGKYYVFGECEELTINIGDQYTDGRLNKYMFEFDSPQDAKTRLSLPASLRYAPSFAIVPNSHFVVVIQGNVVSLVGTNSYYPGAGDDDFFKDFFNGDAATIVVPEGVTKIRQQMFRNIVGLNTIVLPSTLTVIETYAFSGCSGLVNVNLPIALTTLGDRAFENCSSLIGITIPNTLTSIGQYAFYACSKLTTVNLPQGLTVINQNVFAGCTNLVNLTIPSTVQALNASCFSGCGFNSITIPSGVVTIPTSMCANCKSLISVSIPNTVTLIQGTAFNGCSSLQSITLPSSVKELQANVFQSCSALKDVTIHDSIITVVQATSMAGIGANATVKIIGTTRVIPFMTMPNTTQVYVDSTMVASYKAASGWSGIAARIFSLSDLE